MFCRLSLPPYLRAASHSVRSHNGLLLFLLTHPPAHFIRTSGGKGTGRMGRWGSLRGARPGVPSSGGVGGTLGTLRHHPTSTPALRSSINTGPRLSVDSTDMGTEAVQSFHKAALYVFGEKTQIKVGSYKFFLILDNLLFCLFFLVVKFVWMNWGELFFFLLFVFLVRYLLKYSLIVLIYKLWSLYRIIEIYRNKNNFGNRISISISIFQFHMVPYHLWFTCWSYFPLAIALEFYLILLLQK